MRINASNELHFVRPWSTFFLLITGARNTVLRNKYYFHRLTLSISMRYAESLKYFSCIKHCMFIVCGEIILKRWLAGIGENLNTWETWEARKEEIRKRNNLSNGLSPEIQFPRTNFFSHGGITSDKKLENQPLLPFWKMGFLLLILSTHHQILKNNFSLKVVPIFQVIFSRLTNGKPLWMQIFH